MAELVIGTEECSINKIVTSLVKCSSIGVLFTEWSALARNLQVPEDVIQKLRAGLVVNLTFSDVLTALLESWKSRLGSGAILDSLITALQDCHMNDCADSLQKAFQIRKVKLARRQNYVRGPPDVDSFLEGQGQILLLQTLDHQVTLEKIQDAVAVSRQAVVTTEQEILSKDFQTKKIFASMDCCILSCTSNVTEIIPKLIEFPSKIILIIEQQVSDIEAVLGRFHGVSTSRDHQLWSDLSPHFQIKILNRPFCGLMNLAEISKLCKCPAESILTEEALVGLVNNRISNSFQHLLPARISYYIERKVSPRNILPSGLFGSSASGVFVFSGLQRYQLSSMLENRPTDTSGNQIQQSRISAKYILLELKPHFEKICLKTEQPVHWINFNGAQFVWVKSERGIYGVQTSATTNSDVIYSEDEFLHHLDSDEIVDSSTKPVCISDSPGMGKSVLLGELGRKLFLKSPNSIIIHIVIEELINSIKKHLRGKKLEGNSLENALVERACNQEWKAVILPHALRNGSTKVELMLDGFDELQFEDLELAYDCLNLIRESYRTVRLWVATRPHHLHALEHSLQVLGNNLVPFDIADQEKFFVSYWSHQSLDMQRLIQFSRHCLRTLKRNMKGKDEDIAGIPLQCLLIAEVYQQQAVEFSATENVTSEARYPTLEVNSITELYQRLVEMKFNKFFTNYLKQGEELSISHLNHLHVYLSLWLVFPPWAKVFRDRLKIEKVISVQDVFNAGILETKSTVQVPRFLHRTFAEYFIAWFVVHSIRHRCDDNLSSFLFQHVFAKENVSVEVSNYYDIDCQSFKHSVICYFVNSLISKLDIDLTEVQILQNLGFAETNSAVNCSIVDDFPSIFEYIERIGDFETHGKRIFDQTLVIVAVRQSCISLIDRAVKLYEKFYEAKVNAVLMGANDVTLLHFAVENREYSIVEHILHHHGFVELIRKSAATTADLLHCCVTNSEKIIRDQMIAEKIQVIKLLLQIDKGLLEAKNESCESPLLEDNVHIQLLLELIAEGANVFALNGRKETVLHKAGVYLSPENYLKLVSSIPNDSLAKLVIMRDKNGQTPTHKIFNLENPPKSETLQLFHAAGADFDLRHEESVLDRAVAKRHGIHLIKQLISYGADVKARNNKTGATPLHVAAESGHLDCLRLFVELGVEVNIEDEQGLTPLNWALKSNNGNRLPDMETCLYLIEQGGLVMKEEDENGKSLLHMHVQFLNVAQVRLLVQSLQCEVNAMDNRQHRPMHELFLHKRSNDSNGKDVFEIAKILLEGGADVNALNKNGHTPLQLLLSTSPCLLTFQLFSLFDKYGGISSPEISSSTLNTFLVQCSNISQDEFENTVKVLEQYRGAQLDQNLTDNQGNTLLHQAAASGSVHGIRFLVAHGMNINSRNNDSETPLHVANLNKNDNGVETTQLLISLGAELNATNSNLETPAHSAIARNDLPSLQSLIDTNAYQELIQNGELVCCGSRKGNLPIVKYLCELYVNRVGKPLSSIEVPLGDRSVLHAAAARENPEIVRYLLEYEDVYDSLQQMPRMANLLHLCLQNTYDGENYDGYEGGKGFHDTLEVMEAFFAGNPQLATALDESGRCPLLIPQVHPCLLYWLIDNGGDITAKDENGDALTHLAASYLYKLDFHAFLEHLVQKSLSHALFMLGKRNATVLHRAVENIALKEGTLEMFTSLGADFNAVDENDESVFMYAVKGGRKKSFLNNLLQFGCNWTSLDKNSASSLHIACANSNLSATKLLISLGSNVNAREKDGNAPLHFAVGGDDNVEKRSSVAQFLIKNGADVAAQNANLQKPLEYALSRCSHVDKSICDILNGQKVAESEEFSMSEDSDSDSSTSTNMNFNDI